MVRYIPLLVIAFTRAGFCGVPAEPAAEQRPFVVSAAGGDRVDEFYWLRDREDSAVMSYLEAENAYAESLMANSTALIDSLCEEMRARIPEADSTAPWPYNGYLYWSRYNPGTDYPVFLRRTVDGGGAEVVLDVNLLAEGRDYIDAWPVVSPDGSIAGIAMDTTGSLDYTIFFQSLPGGGLLPDSINGTDGSIVWSSDCSTVFYGLQDSTLRTDRILGHILGTPASSDRTIFVENDPTFWPWVFESASDEYVVIESSSTESSETWILAADDPSGEPLLVQPRTPGLEYQVEPAGDTLFILTNLGAPNFRVMKAWTGAPSVENWVDVVPARQDVLIEDIEILPGFIALLVRSDGFSEMRVVDRGSGVETTVAGAEEPSTIWFENNREPSTGTVRYSICSLTTPVSTCLYDASTGSSAVLKQGIVGGGFDPTLYSSSRLSFPSHDGTMVPVSMVWRSDLGAPSGRPLLLEGYGAYGYSSDPWFSSSMLSLLDRGFIYAIAHVRGGSELGREWYDSGRLLEKRNTFLDFIACAEGLVSEGYTSPDRLFATGGSAGGLLIGAVSNMRPDLFRGLVADVPFVDVVTTMLDPGIPLTTNEYEEWGNPSDPVYYDYMLSYSPYDNVSGVDYPAMYVTAGWNDSQVCYWEPAKWVARLRALRTDSDPIVFRVDMGAGHAGASGRYGWLYDQAFKYAFILDQL